MPKRKRGRNTDPVQARLDRVIELLENLLMVTERRCGQTTGQIRSIVSVDANRVSRVTRGVAVIAE